MNGHSLGANTANQASSGGGGFGPAGWATILSSAFNGLSNAMPQPSTGVSSKEIKRRLFADLLSQALAGKNKLYNTDLNSNQFLSNERAKNFRNQSNEAISSFRR